MTHYIVTDKHGNEFYYDSTSADYQLMCIKVRYLMLTKQFPRVKKYRNGKPYNCTEEVYNVVRNQDEEIGDIIGMSPYDNIIAQIYKIALKDYTYETDESTRQGIVEWIKSNPFGLEECFTEKVLKELNKID